MDLQAVAVDLALACDGITGLQGYAWPTGSVSAPAALVALPDRLHYDGAGARGLDRIEISVLLLIPKADERSAVKSLNTFCNSTGALSVKVAIEAFTSSAWDDATVHGARFEGLKLAGVDYIGAVFKVDVHGAGT